MTTRSAVGGRWVYPFGPGLSESGDQPGREQLGGKGAGLAEMSRAGLPVPPGFTITTDCCRAFFAAGERWPEGLEEEVRAALAALEQTVGRPFGRGATPLLVSVRSGAAVSMPGMMDTLLNCGLHPGLADTLGAAAGFWPVYTQFILMFARTVAGIPASAFGTDGAAEAADRRSVEACLRTYREQTGHDFPTEPWPLLRECISAVFRSWGSDRAVAYRRRNDICGLDVARDVEPARLAEIERLRGLAGSGRRMWVAHNLGETLRAPTPLSWDIVRRFMSGAGGFGRFYQDLGYRPAPQVCTEGFLELVGPRIYADPDRVAQLFWGESPLGYDRDALAKDTAILDQAPTFFDPDRADGTFFLRVPAIVATMLRASRRSKQLRGTVRESFERQTLPPYLAYVRAKRGQDLTRLDTPQVLAELHDRCRRVLDDFGKESLKPGFFGALASTELRGLLMQLMGSAEGSRVACELAMGLEGDTTVTQNELLERVAHGAAGIGEFLEAYGHRAVGEMELAEPRYRERPDQLDNVLEAMRSGRPASALHEEHVRRRAAMEAELPAVLARWGGASFASRSRRPSARRTGSSPTANRASTT